MTAKQYLRQIEKATATIEAYARRREELEARAQGIGAIRYDKDRVQTSPRDTLPDAVIKLIELDARYMAAILNEQLFKADAMRRIAALKNPKHIKVLELRYVDCLTWEAVAEAMGYKEVSSAPRTEKRALIEFARANRDIIDGR